MQLQPRASQQPEGPPASRSASRAERDIAMLRRQGRLDESALIRLASSGKLEETVAGLASLCGIPLEVVKRLMQGGRLDPVLILCRSAGWKWPTAQALIRARAGSAGPSRRELDEAQAHFELLSPTTAQRVVRFWQVWTS
jgi:hypothetical protein